VCVTQGRACERDRGSFTPRGNRDPRTGHLDGLRAVARCYVCEANRSAGLGRGRRPGQASGDDVLQGRVPVVHPRGSRGDCVDYLDEVMDPTHRQRSRDVFMARRGGKP